MILLQAPASRLDAISIPDAATNIRDQHHQPASTRGGFGAPRCRSAKGPSELRQAPTRPRSTANPVRELRFTMIPHASGDQVSLDGVVDSSPAGSSVHLRAKSAPWPAPRSRRQRPREQGRL